MKTQMNCRMILKLAEWIVFLILLIVGIYFLHGVVRQYQAKESSLSQSFQNIAKLPTLVICFDGPFTWRYGIDFDISYKIDDQNGDEYEKLNFEKKFISGIMNKTVQLTQVDPRCYKLNSTFSEATVGNG